MGIKYRNEHSLGPLIKPNSLPMKEYTRGCVHLSSTMRDNRRLRSYTILTYIIGIPKRQYLLHQRGNCKLAHYSLDLHDHFITLGRHNNSSL